MEDWRTRANCRGSDPEIFFPGKNDSETMEIAKSVCRGCPVTEECLAFCLSVPEGGGVWGGTSERQRRGMHLRAGLRILYT